ncbi:unnamed protein product [Amoebophrya sp. A120]|nr:unnamed protein product [Amoebophrya sp. A120]|eukprot:GSA120T00016616001.1
MVVKFSFMAVATAAVGASGRSAQQSAVANRQKLVASKKTTKSATGTQNYKKNARATTRVGLPPHGFPLSDKPLDPYELYSAQLRRSVGEKVACYTVADRAAQQAQSRINTIVVYFDDLLYGTTEPMHASHLYPLSQDGAHKMRFFRFEKLPANVFADLVHDMRDSQTVDLHVSQTNVACLNSQTGTWEPIDEASEYHVMLPKMYVPVDMYTPSSSIDHKMPTLDVVFVFKGDPKACSAGANDESGMEEHIGRLVKMKESQGQQTPGAGRTCLHEVGHPLRDAVVMPQSLGPLWPSMRMLATQPSLLPPPEEPFKDKLMQLPTLGENCQKTDHYDRNAVTEEQRLQQWETLSNPALLKQWRSDGEMAYDVGAAYAVMATQSTGVGIGHLNCRKLDLAWGEGNKNGGVAQSYKVGGNDVFVDSSAPFVLTPANSASHLISVLESEAAAEEEKRTPHGGSANTPRPGAGANPPTPGAGAGRQGDGIAAAGGAAATGEKVISRHQGEQESEAKGGFKQAAGDVATDLVRLGGGYLAAQAGNRIRESVHESEMRMIEHEKHLRGRDNYGGGGGGCCGAQGGVDHTTKNDPCTCGNNNSAAGCCSGFCCFCWFVWIVVMGLCVGLIFGVMGALGAPKPSRTGAGRGQDSYGTARGRGFTGPGGPPPTMMMYDDEVAIYQVGPPGVQFDGDDNMQQPQSTYLAPRQETTGRGPGGVFP